MGWRAVTESGRVYETVSGGVKVSGEGYFHNADVKVVNREDLYGMESRGIWEHLHNLPRADLPEVGKSLYIDTYGDAGWRISTDIVSVEITGD